MEVESPGTGQPTFFRCPVNAPSPSNGLRSFQIIQSHLLRSLKSLRTYNVYWITAAWVFLNPEKVDSCRSIKVIYILLQEISGLLGEESKAFSIGHLVHFPENSLALSVLMLSSRRPPETKRSLSQVVFNTHYSEGKRTW